MVAFTASVSMFETYFELDQQIFGAPVPCNLSLELSKAYSLSCHLWIRD